MFCKLQQDVSAGNKSMSFFLGQMPDLLLGRERIMCPHFSFFSGGPETGLLAPCVLFTPLVLWTWGCAGIRGERWAALEARLIDHWSLDTR